MLYGVVLFNLSEFSLTVDNPKQLLVYSLLILKSAIHFAKNDFSVWWAAVMILFKGNLLTSCSRILENLTGHQVIKNSWNLEVYESVSLVCILSSESRLPPILFKVRIILVLFIHLYLCLPCGLFQVPQEQAKINWIIQQSILDKHQHLLQLAQNFTTSMHWVVY